jgi:hypothetical protein
VRAQGSYKLAAPPTDDNNAAMGITWIYEYSQTWFYVSPIGYKAYLSYFSISLALNISLTMLIITRLFQHRRNLQNVVGGSSELSGLYNSVITTIVESYAPYTVVSALNLGLLAVSSPFQSVFFPALSYSQVRVPSTFPPTRSGTRTL